MSHEMDNPRPQRRHQIPSGPLSARHPGIASFLILLALLGACERGAREPAAALSSRDREAIARQVEQRLREATDLRAGGDAMERMLSLYPDTGRVVSVAAGEVTTTRDSLADAVRYFWTSTGRNMRNPEWRWGPMQIDVLGPDAAVVSATYRIPHLTPAGTPHVIGGAWTAVFARRGGEWVVVQEHLSDSDGPISPTP